MESRIRIRIDGRATLGFMIYLWRRLAIKDLRVSHEEAQQQDLVSKLQPRQSAIKQYCNNQHKNQLLYFGEYNVFYL